MESLCSFGSAEEFDLNEGKQQSSALVESLSIFTHTSSQQQMESPTLSRSPSQTFAPSRGRRSHTNVHHLSLAPLTPKYPIDPADYDAYFDPTTSQLHTSTSLSQISGLPSPGGILTNSPARSRAGSRHRQLKRPKSRVSIQEPQPQPLSTSAAATTTTTTPSGAVSSEGLGHRKPLKVQTDWLVQTGLALTEGSRESKGQSWIVKRDSSTSLNMTDEHHHHHHHQSKIQRHQSQLQLHQLQHQTIPLTPGSNINSGGNRSGRTTPRSRSRRRSKKSLRMTPAASFTTTPPGAEDGSVLEPDWAEDEEVLLQRLQDEEGDPYEMDFDDNFSDEDAAADEEEVRRAISKYKLGQWMDNVVDVMLKLEEDEEKGEDDNDDGRSHGHRRRQRHLTFDEQQDGATGDVEPPPTHPKGVWEDVAWFGRLLARTVRS